MTINNKFANRIMSCACISILTCAALMSSSKAATITNKSNYVKSETASNASGKIEEPKELVTYIPNITYSSYDDYYSYLDEEIIEDEKEEEVASEEDIIIDYGNVDDIDYVASVAIAEAGNQGEIGLRLVIDTILNRADKYNVSTTQILNEPNQYNPDYSNWYYRERVTDEVRELVIEETSNRYDSNVIYYNNMYFFSWATPLYKYGDHYFSM